MQGGMLATGQLKEDGQLQLDWIAYLHGLFIQKAFASHDSYRGN